MNNPEQTKVRQPLSCAILTASDTRTAQNDTSGDLIEVSLINVGHKIKKRAIVKENIEELKTFIGETVNTGTIDILLITGGTGITKRDLTPEAVGHFSTKEIPGFGELFRWLSYQDIGSSTIQSRACAHLCENTIVFALPGSTSAVRLALEKIILPQLDIDHKPCNFAQLLPRIR